MSALRNILRILLGMVFIFSGFVKGVDPLGTAYKIEDYMIVYGAQWAEPLALVLSIVLCALEFSLGVYLLLNIKPKTTSWLVLLLMIYFTVVTFFDALYNLVPDCGCFGDALKLTNWQTFYKNIVLIVFAFIVFRARKAYNSPFRMVTGWVMIALIPLFFIGFEIYNIRHLPVVDFTAWKKGNRMIPQNLQPVNYYLVYQNKASGEIKEFLSKDLPYSDSIFMAEWAYKDTRIDDPNVYPAPNFNIIDTAGNDVTKTYLQQAVFLVCGDVLKSDPEGLKKASDLVKHLGSLGYTVIGLTASDFKVADSIKAVYQLDLDFYQTDDIELKTMVRSNPGLVRMNDATVMGKWHYNDFPDEKERLKLFPPQ